MPVLCPKCGSANTDGSTFCIGCGVDLGAKAVPAAGAPPTGTKTAAGTAAGTGGGDPQGAPPSGQQPQSPWPEQPSAWNPPPPGYAQPSGYGQPPPPPQGYGPPNYGQYGPQGYGAQGYAYYGGPQVNNNMAMSVISLVLGAIFGCLVLAVPGLVAVIMSSQVASKLATGDIAGAEHSARTAKAWSIVGFVLVGLSILVGALLIIGVAVNSDPGSY